MSNMNMNDFRKWAEAMQKQGKEGGDNRAHLDRHQSVKRESLEDVIRKNAEDKKNTDNT